MNFDTDSPRLWQACSPGTLGRYARRARLRRRLQWTAWSASALLVSAALAVWVYQTPPSGPPTSDITCTQVQQYQAAFVTGKLSGELRARIAEHLEKCPHCRKGMPSADTRHGTFCPDRCMAGPLPTAGPGCSAVLLHGPSCATPACCF